MMLNVYRGAAPAVAVLKGKYAKVDNARRTSSASLTQIVPIQVPFAIERLTLALMDVVLMLNVVQDRVVSV